jgi:PAS domain S-box-containing protein
VEGKMTKDRVLVVEDEAIVARDICVRLENMGYEVVETTDTGEKAVSLSRQHGPDLVLMDIVIKGKNDGIDAGTIIKEELGIPIIFLTAYADEITLERAKITEPFGYIIKPFNDRDLDVTVKMALSKSRLEKKLIEREERYRDLFENTNDIIMILDEKGNFRYVNKRWHQSLGYDEKEMLGLNIFDILDKNCLENCRANFKKVLKGDDISVEAILHTKEGHGVIVEGNCNCSTAPGKPNWVRGIFRDITERKKSQKLQEAMYQIANETVMPGALENFYARIHSIISSLMDTKNFFIAIYDKNKGQLSFPYFMDEHDCIPQTKEMGSGITEYVIRNKKPLLATPEIYKKLVDSGEIKVSGQTPIDWLGVPLLVSENLTGVLVVQTYDQGIRFGETEKEILTFISDQVAFAIQRKLADEALRLSEEKYRSLVEQINDVIFLVDPSGNIIYISPVIEKITNFTVDEIIGQPFSKFIHSDDLPGLKQSFNRTLNGIDEPWEYRILNKNGTTVFVRSSSRLIKDDQDEPAGLMGTITDITQPKLMAVQLQQAQKMEAIGQLAGGIAHDFNNLLSGIIGNAEMLQIKLANEPALASLAEKILTTGEHAATLTKQLLSFARKGNYQQVPVNIHRTINDVVNILESTLDKRIAVHQSLNASPCLVLGDPAMLENAILNLGINARDAMPDGGTLIFSTNIVKLENDYVTKHNYKIPEGTYLQIKVTDTGLGMSREIQTHLFEPFFTTKETGKGTGLGLASVYGCVKSHNGSIEVYSEEGHGSEFKVYLPLLADANGRSEEKSHEAIISGSGTILLVDDEEMIRDIACQMLEDRGYKVITLSNGQEAVDYYRSNGNITDLVILDMIMPKMGGYEAFLKIKEINPNVKVLLSSGYSIEEEAHDLMKSGVKGFLQKPYRLAELTQKIKEALVL